MQTGQSSGNPELFCYLALNLPLMSSSMKTLTAKLNAAAAQNAPTVLSVQTAQKFGGALRTQKVLRTWNALRAQQALTGLKNMSAMGALEALEAAKLGLQFRSLKLR